VSLEAWVVVVVALIFDFLNGFHDAANSIATAVSTRVLSPRLAVAWAAFWNFVAFIVFGTAVAKTIGSGIIDIEQVTSVDVILAAVVGAIAWNIITWYFALPSSSSHALVGGLVGAALVATGPDSLVASGIVKTAVFIFISPVVGFVLAVVLMNFSLLAGQRISRRLSLERTNAIFRKLQLVSAGAYSLGHGANDAQKTMGIITAVILVDAGRAVTDFEVSFATVIAAQAAIALGTLAGGWRIVRTLGARITKLQPVGGFSAETGAALTLFTTAHFGIPVSTTHTITGAVVGVGTTNRFSAVRWGLTRRVVYAWIVTIPGAALIAAATWWLTRVVPPTAVGLLVMVGMLAWGGAWARVKYRGSEAVFAPPG
jgi:inorganic phosphate transporter, PiT family